LVAVVVVLLSMKESIPPFSRPIPQEFNDFKQNKTDTHTHSPKKEEGKEIIIFHNQQTRAHAMIQIQYCFQQD
jgi:hypothetical protein